MKIIKLEPGKRDPLIISVFLITVSFLSELKNKEKSGKISLVFSRVLNGMHKKVLKRLKDIVIQSQYS